MFSNILISLFLAHVDDVRAIVQRAVKDLAIEKSLKTYEEVWLSKLFELRIHIRSKSVEQADGNMNVRNNLVVSGQSKITALIFRFHP